MIGQTISHYKILEKLGGGGMGVVYKAQDTKLDRFVALKFLPPDMTVDAEAKERFVHEARAASALQHNNICTVHDIDESLDGQMFIVMDCYEGETLKARIAKGKLRIEEATDYASQIAQGLSEAHTHGIIHRDVKPANILITKGGVAKIVDFGLAKLSGATKMTKTGSTLGTIAYMAPEQLQGGNVDARADIFSLGVVLYEMLTGKLPFRGDHEAALMYAILNEEPEPLQTHIPDVSSELIHIVGRALEKDPARRYKTMDDLLIDLQRIKHDTSEVLGTAARTARGHKLFQRRRIVAVVGAALIVVLAATATLFLLRSRGPRLNPKRTTLKIKVPPNFNEIWYATLSQDGKWIAFPRRDEKNLWDVYLMNATGGEPRRVSNDSAAMIFGSDISPDISQIVYSSLSVGDTCYRVNTVSSQGGPSRTIADIGFAPMWRPDGKRIAYQRGGRGGLGTFASTSGNYEVWSIRPDGTDNRLEFIDTVRSLDWPFAVCWSPDGRSIAWVRTYPGGYSEIMVCELSTGKQRKLTFDEKMVDEPSWATNDVILFISNKSGPANLWMIPAAGGDAIQVTQGTIPVLSGRLSVDCKTLVYNQREYFGHVWISAHDGSNPHQVTSGDLYISECSFSPDGKHMACQLADVDQFKPEHDLVVMDRDGKNQRQLTSGSVIAGGPEWSADSKWLAYYSFLAGEPLDSINVYVTQLYSSTSPRLLFKRSGRLLYRWVDEERIVTYQHGKSLLYSVRGGAAVQIYRDSTFAIPIRRDTELLYRDFRSGRAGWWVVSVDSTGREKSEAKKLPVQSTAFFFSTDFRFLIYLKRERQGAELWRMWISTGHEERIGKSHLSSWADLRGVSPDGKEIYWTNETFRATLGLMKDVFE